MLFYRISLYFMTGFCIFKEKNGLLITECSQNQVYLLTGGHVGV